LKCNNYIYVISSVQLFLSRFASNESFLIRNYPPVKEYPDERADMCNLPDWLVSRDKNTFIWKRILDSESKTTYRKQAN
jgi:hypothetical protein